MNVDTEDVSTGTESESSISNGRYPKRNIARVNYTEEELPRHDDQICRSYLIIHHFIHIIGCGRQYLELTIFY